MSEYNVPSEYFCRLHHVRPRFKNEVENVLGYVAFGIVDIGKRASDEFKQELNAFIRTYGSNANSSDKTINNWRTEIAALFGMYKEYDDISIPTSASIDLANESNLERFFRNFIFTFQYPGGHLKSNAIMELLNNGISFHPGRWLAEYFLSADNAYITKAEFCHCVFHDMRVTRDHEKMEDTIQRILHNRAVNAEYDTQGDTVRYAGDILDYMVLGGMLWVDNDNRYKKMPAAHSVLFALKNDTRFFSKYDEININNQAINAIEPEWFDYVDREYQHTNELLEPEQTQAVKFTDRSESPDASSQETSPCSQSSFDPNEASTAETGNRGENLAHVHEILRVKAAGREDLVHLIKRIPTHLAVGYDIKSVEVLTEDMRAIEVKTSISKQPLTFNRFHLTTNEWKVAEDLGDKYFVYRLAIHDEGYTLFIIRNPVRKYKQDLIKMIPRDGADIIFDDNAGTYEELLCIH